MIDVLQKARVHLRLPSQHGLKGLRHLVPCRNLFVACCQLAVRRYDAELLLTSKGFFAELVPALIELALVLVGPFLRHMVRRMGCSGCKIHEERFVRRQRLLLRDPVSRLIRHVLHQVVALFRCLFGLDWGRAFVKRWVPLARLASDEAIEILEATASRWPSVERPNRARLPYRHLVTLTELRCGIAVELEGSRQGRDSVRQDRVVTRSGGSNLGNPAHPDRVMVASG